MIPRDAIGFLNGSFYKMGRANKLFYWDGEWLRSSRDSVEVMKGIGRKKYPFDMANS